jgi:large subunit ribosomal protein L30
MAKLKVKWVKSLIGYEADQRRTVRALGLKKLHQTVEHQDTPTIQGMLRKVRHLIQVELVEQEGA